VPKIGTSYKWDRQMLFTEGGKLSKEHAINCKNLLTMLMFSSHKLEHLGIYIYSFFLRNPGIRKKYRNIYYLMLRTKGGGEKGAIK